MSSVYNVDKCQERKPDGYWKIMENCEQEARKYGSIKEFQLNCRCGYMRSLKEGWLDMWFKRKVKPRNYADTKEKCERIARKYETRSDFKKGDYTAYRNSLKEGWIDDFKWLESRNVLKDGYHVYVYELEEKQTAYVGLSCQRNNGRDAQHRSGKKYSAIHEYCEKNNLLIPQPKILKNGLSVGDARKWERYYIKEYRKRGWNMLNRNDGGSVGGGFFLWKDEKIQNAVDQCKSISELHHRFPGAYYAASKKGCLYKMFAKNGIKPKNVPYKDIFVWDAGYGNYIGKYKDVSDAANKLKLSSREIRNVLEGKSSFHKGYIFTLTCEKPANVFDKWKKVLQIDDAGKVVKIWKNQAEAYGNGFGDVYRAIENGLKCNGFRFRYATKDDVEMLDGDCLCFSPYVKRENGRSKKVVQYSLDGDFIAEYPSSREAARKTNSIASGICFCCTGKLKTHNGFIWKYAE